MESTRCYPMGQQPGYGGDVEADEGALAGERTRS